MTVLEVVRKYNLELADKQYESTIGNIVPLPNLDALAELEVKDFYYNLKTNHARITVIGIEDIK